MKSLAVLTFQQLSQIHAPLTSKTTGQWGLEAQTYILYDEMYETKKAVPLLYETAFVLYIYLKFRSEHTCYSFYSSN